MTLIDPRRKMEGPKKILDTDFYFWKIETDAGANGFGG